MDRWERSLQNTAQQKDENVKLIFFFYEVKNNLEI